MNNYQKNYQGLTSTQVEELLKVHGENSRPAVKNKTWVRRLFDIVSEPMILLLLSAAVIYFFIGDKLEAVILLCSIIPILAIEFFQESKTDEAVRALDKMMVQYVEVFRDGERKKIEAKFLVPGDYVYLTAGDRVSADGFILNSPGVQVDESMLTGESVSVTKSEFCSGQEKIKEENLLYQGTMIVQGEGYLVVEKTGGATKYGQLGNLLEKIITEKTPLQQKMHRLVSMVAVVAIISAVGVGAIMTLKEGWTHGFLAGITIAMSLIPEEFPVVFSVFLIMGVWRMTKQKALVREMAMVETLGSATVICTDKTGTLTEGKMALKQVYFNDELVEISDGNHNQEIKDLITGALLSLEQVAIDPIEIEVQRYADKLGIDVNKYFNEHTLVQDLPFESKTKMVHHLWKHKSGLCEQHTAGAPEFVIESSTLKKNAKDKIMSAYETMADQGYRVIGIAKRACHESGKIVIEDLQFVGLLAMSDPPRAGVKEAIDTCQKAGIRIIMITGDNKLTAHSVAEQIGLKHNEEIMTGADLKNMSPSALQETVRRHDIFTRVEPEQKYLLVEALQNQGEIVAMTGDGVNDAPALKKANIGIAMGQKGTEVARAAAGIILMDDNFATIVNAVKEGRRIYDNLRQAFVFLFSFHLPIIGLAVLPLFFGEPLIFLPIHIIFLELICDPASVIGFEKEKARHGLMLEKPRSIKEPLVNPRSWIRILLQGGIILALSFGLYYYYALYLGQDELGKSLAFGSLVAAQIFLIFFTREWEQVKTNKVLLIINAISFVFLILCFVLTPLQTVFHLASLSSVQFALMIGLPAFVMILFKVFSSKISNHK
ncbi:MAG: cation-translocating P-type ATPase [Candidatus Magasanikiibacteriota bacterium]